MNSLLSKNADDKTVYLIDKLQTLIKGTRFEGHVFMVGGAVRDLLLGCAPKDYDFVVDLENGGIIFANWLAAKDGSYIIGKNPVIYETYGTAKIRLLKDKKCEGLEIECVQTRKEKYNKESRNPATCFGTIEDDAIRRDLTINAIYYNISSEEILDICGTSLSDLNNKLLRTPGNPDLVFEDDPLRMLRVIRFSAKLEWGIDKDTWFGIIKNAHRIPIISQERITDEINKILLSRKPSEAFIKLRYSGLLELIIKDLYDEKYAKESYIYNVTWFDHTMMVLDKVRPYLEHRWAALLHDIGRPINNGSTRNDFSAEAASLVMTEMKLPTKLIKSVVTAIKNHEYMKCYSDGVLPSDKKIRKMIAACGDDIAITLDLMNANNVSVTLNKKLEQVELILGRMEELEEKENLSNIKPPITGNDIMSKFHVKQGPIIGFILSLLSDKYFENPSMTKEECFSFVKEIIDGNKK